MENHTPLHPAQTAVIDEFNKLENALLAGMNRMSLAGGDPSRLGSIREHIEAAFAGLRHIAADRPVAKPAEYPAFQRPEVDAQIDQRPFASPMKEKHGKKKDRTLGLGARS